MTGLSKPAAGALLTAPLTKGSKRTWLFALSPVPAGLAGLTGAGDWRACCIQLAVATAGKKKDSWVHWKQIECHTFQPVNYPHCLLRPRDSTECPGPGCILHAEASSVQYIGKVRQMISEGSQASASLLRPCSVTHPSLSSQGMSEATSPAGAAKLPPTLCLSPTQPSSSPCSVLFPIPHNL